MEKRDSKLSRRSVLKTTAAVAAVGGAVSLAGCNEANAKKSSKSIKFDNSYFYDADGKFSEEKAKDAVIALMNYHGCPVFDGFKEKLWVSDYGTGQFTKLGLAANMYYNNEDDHYMLMDFYLLPGQMLPEHYHVKTDKNPAKLEGWLCRYGLSYVYGEGEPTTPMKAVVPKCHMNGKVTVSHEVALTPGMFTPLTKVNSPHWQFGGPEGAVITEVANVHDNDGVRHTDTNLRFP